MELWKNFEEFCEFYFNDSNFLEFAEAIKKGNFDKTKKYFYMKNGVIMATDDEDKATTAEQ